MNSEAQEQARKQARLALAKFPNPTANQIQAACEKAKRWTEEDCGADTVELEELVTYFLRTSNIFVAPLQLLSDSRGHVEWLPSRRGEIEWKFWQRYQTFLQDIEELPNPVVNSVDLRTESILEQLEDPTRAGSWDRRGLVVGSVQSGKTGNFLGLACKALDAGYKLVVILAGIHNSLRAQTQVRMEEGLLGYNTDSSLFYEAAGERVGVGTLLFDGLHVNSMTSRGDAGDFSSAKLGTTVHLGGTPFVVVVKKHVRILENLRTWITKRNGADAGDGRKIVRDIPMLVIDDEADHSSINTKKLKKILPDGVTEQDVDPTKINQQIRALLSTFEKSAYVGYTATPFANIFVDPRASHEKLGDDLFPRSFIVSLPAPDTYVSVEKVFGRDGDPDAGMEARTGYPLTRVVDDFGDLFPEKPTPSFVPTQLPASLHQAVRSFILSCTARHARGQATKHNSMLIHVARYVGAQRQIKELVEQELLFLQRRIGQESADAAKSVRRELKALWEADFLPTTAAVADADCSGMTWEQIEPHLQAAVSKIRALEINGTSADILDYERNKKTGISVIAVGGDKLSRGLTLEGLTVSYYMRVSRMYDSLLQMGRWFGYRPGYIDLCRIYTSQDLIDWYRHIALAEAELRREFERMAALKATPEQYGLRVRTHPDGMLVTALNKSRASTVMQISFEGTLAQCVLLDARTQTIKDNETAVENLVSGLGSPRLRNDKSRTRIWTANAEAVCSFLNDFVAPYGTNGFDSHRLAEFISLQQERGDLTNWTVALLAVSGKARTEDVCGERIGLVTRKNTSTKPGIYQLPNSNVLNPPDQAIDFEDATLDSAWIQHLLNKAVFSTDEAELIEASHGRNAWDVALRISLARFEEQRVAGQIRADQKPPTQPLGRVIREMRKSSHGLLLLYPLDGKDAEVTADIRPIFSCAISFPSTARAVPIEYRVNDVYKQLHLDLIEEQD